MTVEEATRVQLEHWHKTLASGADRIGWKVGFNVPATQEKLGLDRPVVGHLTSATLVGADGIHSLAGAEAPLAEPEIAVEVGPDAVIAGLGAAIEIADVPELPGSPDDVPRAVEGNIFHRAAAIGPSRARELPSELEAVLTVNGEERERAAVGSYPLAELVRAVRERLEQADESLEVGDRIIAGTLTRPAEVEAGDRVALELGPLGRVEVELVS